MVRNRNGGPRNGKVYAVGVEHRCVDAVERSSTHQADCFKKVRHRATHIEFRKTRHLITFMAEFRSDFLQLLQLRGHLHQVTDEAALDALLRVGCVPGYIGFDCTGPSLHVGNLVQIMTLRRLQQTGHKPIVVMGGGTTKIGDPSGKDEMRQVLTPETIAVQPGKNSRHIFAFSDIRRWLQRCHHGR